MRIFHPLTCCALFLGTAACSIHPIPYDIPGYNTLDIVRKIRCEAARAIEKNIVVGLRKTLSEQGRYADAVIVYNFTFAITENNDIGAGAGFKLPLTNSTFTLGIDGGAERERSGSREFTVTDSFAETLEEIYEFVEVKGDRGKKTRKPFRPKPCAREAAGENWTYPITGTIGLDETIRTFVELNSLRLLDPRAQDFEFPDAAAQPPGPTAKRRPAPQTLAPLARNFYSYAGRDKRPKAGGGKTPQKKSEKKEANTEEFSDTLEFTTTIKASASPKIELKSVASSFRLTGADASLSGQRTDRHKVIITLTFPKKGETPEETRERAQFTSDARVTRSLQESLIKAFRR